MTPTEIDALNDTALSEAVARDVLGWALKDGYYWCWEEEATFLIPAHEVDFTHSMDACIEHLAPVLAARNIVVRMELLPSGESVCWVNNNSGGNISRDPDPATAFCRAALKAVAG